MASIERLPILLIALLLLGADDEPFLFLHSIPIEIRDGVEVDLTRPVRIEIRSRDPRALAVANMASIESAVDGDRLTLEVTSYPVLEDEPSEQHLQPSFVVDFDEAPVVELAAQLREQRGERPSLDSLTTFVHDAISGKNYTRSWDVASVVAGRREGDCTEHAVLATALARASGIPARLVLGVVIFEHEGTIGAFGHAWSEFYDGARWQVADATRIADTATVRYLREGVLDTEGTGFALSLMNVSTRTRSIAILDSSQ